MLDIKTEDLVMYLVITCGILNVIYLLILCYMCY